MSGPVAREQEGRSKANERTEFCNTVINGAGNMIFIVVDREGYIAFCSRSLAEHSRSSSKKIVGISGRDFSAPEALELKLDVYDNLMKTPIGSSESRRLRIPRKDGSSRDVEVLHVRPDIAIVLCTRFSERIIEH
jgi:PAS domain-containing protein